MSNEQEHEPTEAEQTINHLKDGFHDAEYRGIDTRQLGNAIYLEGMRLFKAAFAKGEHSGRKTGLALLNQFKLGFIEAAERQRREYTDAELEFSDDDTSPPDEYLEGMEAYDRAFLAGREKAEQERERAERHDRFRQFYRGFIDAQGGFEKPQDENRYYHEGFMAHHKTHSAGYEKGARNTAAQLLDKNERHYKDTCDRLVRHFAPIVLSHPQFKPPGWDVAIGAILTEEEKPESVTLPDATQGNPPLAVTYSDGSQIYIPAEVPPKSPDAKPIFDEHDGQQEAKPVIPPDNPSESTLYELPLDVLSGQGNATA